MLYVGLLNEENERCLDEEQIGEIFQRFYENLSTLSLPAIEKIDKLLIVVHPPVTDEMSKSLEKGFMIEENKRAVFSISADKSS